MKIKRKKIFGVALLGMLCLCCLTVAVLLYADKPPLLEDVPFSVHIVDARGTSLRLSMSEDAIFRLYVPLAEIPLELQKATLLYEDRYFFLHWGVNPLSLLRGAFSLLGLERRMGGSTITMQVARLRYGLDTGTIHGKIRQIFYALLLEWHYSKAKILEAYFNLAPYGGNIEGIGAAAHIYFRKAPMRMVMPEMLALVGIPQNPVRRNPLRGDSERKNSFHAAHKRITASWLAEYGQSMSDDERTLLGIPDVLRIYGSAALPFEAPHLCDDLLAQELTAVQKQSVGLAPASANMEWRKEPDFFGKEPASTERSASDALFRERTVRTFIESALQRRMEQSIEHYVSRRATFGVSNAAAILVYWPRMEVQALVGSARFHSKPIQGQVDGTRARRSPGSTLKPFIYALALDQGLIHSRTLLADAPHSFGDYNPENYDQSFRGPINARDALRASRNIPAIALAERLRTPDLYTFLQRADIRLPQAREHYGLSLVLGGAELEMRELATLYAMLANQGLWQPLRLAQQRPHSPLPPPPRRLISPEAAFITSMMLRTEQPMLRPDLPAFLKTGTSNGFRDAWAAGIFGSYVLIVWLGNFDNSSNPVFVGADLAVPLWEDIASTISRAIPANCVDRITARAAALNVKQLNVCAESGDIDTTLCSQSSQLAPAWFIPGVSPIRSTDIYREILIDTASGMRACIEGADTTKKVWEFWPSDLQRIFILAGIHKAPPPPFIPACSEQAALNGQPPRILVPKSGVVYQHRARENSAIPLTASTGAEADAIYWFADTRFIGKSRPDEPCLWQPHPGKITIQAIDSLGRTAARVITVEAQ